MSTLLHEGADVDPMTDHDAVTELVFNQTDDGDTRALGPDETFDWPMIEAEHRRLARERLGTHGIEWDPDTGAITCPAATDAAQAEAIWDQVRSEVDGWLLDLIDEIREGKPTEEGAERTTGHEWVAPL